jgi:hypothetical protein
MAAPDGRIERGQPLESAISARAWNRAQDAADIVLGARVGMSALSPRTPAPPFVSLPCKNASGIDVPRFGVLAVRGFDSVEIKPTSSASAPETLQFQTHPVLRGTGPVADETVVAIAVEPIRSNAVGMVALSGVVQAKIEIKSTTHWFATTKNNNVSELKTSATEGLPIIWKPNETGVGKFALVCVQPFAKPTMRLGKITNGWAKGSTKTVTRYNGDGTELEDGDPVPTFEAINRFATVAALDERWVACALIDETWHLVAAEC